MIRVTLKKLKLVKLGEMMNSVQKYFKIFKKNVFDKLALQFIHLSFPKYIAK